MAGVTVCWDAAATSEPLKSGLTFCAWWCSNVAKMSRALAMSMTAVIISQTPQWSHLCSTSCCSCGAIHANQNLQDELELGTGYCVYTRQSRDGREPRSALLWSGLSIHCMPSVFITAYTGGPPECSAGECYNSKQRHAITTVLHHTLKPCRITWPVCTISYQMSKFKY